MNTSKDPYGLAKLPTELWDIDKIKPYARNTKVHSPAHINKLKKSIEADGLFDALIVDMDGEIIAGHGRFEALVSLGHTKVPVKHAAHLTKNQAAAARISHNKTASVEYDSGFLAEELAKLQGDPDIDMDGLGLEDQEFNMLVLGNIGEINDDAFSTDLALDIDNQEAETAEKVKQTDEGMESISKALGFSKISIADVKKLRAFIAEIEEETGMKGAEAFVNWLDARGRSSEGSE